MALEVDTDESPRKGRSNAILTYEKVEEISLGIQKALLGIEYLTKQVDETHMDHEARLRVLEANQQNNKGGLSLAAYLVPILLSLPGIIISVVAYLKP